MKNTILALTILFAVASCQFEKKEKTTSGNDIPTAKDSLTAKLVTQAYIFGYPMMTMSYTHK